MVGKEEVKAAPLLVSFSYFYSVFFALTMLCLHADYYIVREKKLGDNDSAGPPDAPLQLPEM